MNNIIKGCSRVRQMKIRNVKERQQITDILGILPDRTGEDKNGILILEKESDAIYKDCIMSITMTQKLKADSINWRIYEYIDNELVEIQPIEMSYPTLVLHMEKPENENTLNLYNWLDGSRSTYDFGVDWGDKSYEYFTYNNRNLASCTRTYSASTKNITIYLRGTIDFVGLRQNTTNNEISKWLKRVEIVNANPIKNTYRAFKDCSKLTSIPDNFFSACSELSDYSYMFAGCSSLTNFPSTILATAKSVTSVAHMYDGCLNIGTKFNKGNIFEGRVDITDFTGCFANCSTLVGDSTGTLMDNFTSSTYNVSELFKMETEKNALEYGGSLYMWNRPTFTNIFQNAINLKALTLKDVRESVQLDNILAVLPNRTGKEMGKITLMKKAGSSNNAILEITVRQRDIAKNINWKFVDEFGNDIIPPEEAYPSITLHLEKPANLNRFNLYDWLDSSKYTYNFIVYWGGEAGVREEYNNSNLSLCYHDFNEVSTNDSINVIIRAINGNFPFIGLKSNSSSNPVASWLTGISTNNENCPVTNLYKTFKNCSKLNRIGTKVFDNCGNVTDFTSMFEGCSSLISFPTGTFDSFSKIAKFDSAFKNSAIREIPLFSNNKSFTSANNCFENCTQIESTPNGLFQGNTKLQYVNEMFKGCSKLISFGTNTFSGCTALKEAEGLFAHSGIKTITGKIFPDSSQLTTIENFFYECLDLETVPFDAFNGNPLISNYNDAYYPSLGYDDFGKRISFSSFTQISINAWSLSLDISPNTPINEHTLTLNTVYLNNIRGGGVGLDVMDMIIENLPKRTVTAPGKLILHKSEESFYTDASMLILKKQVNAAAAKYWNIYDINMNLIIPDDTDGLPTLVLEMDEIEAGKTLDLSHWFSYNAETDSKYTNGITPTCNFRIYWGDNDNNFTDILNLSQVSNAKHEYVNGLPITYDGDNNPVYGKIKIVGTCDFMGFDETDDNNPNLGFRPYLLKATFDTLQTWEEMPIRNTKEEEEGNYTYAIPEGYEKGDIIPEGFEGHGTHFEYQDNQMVELPNRYGQYIEIRNILISEELCSSPLRYPKRLFFGCSKLHTVSYEIFSSCTNAKLFNDTFNGCSSLKNIGTLDYTRLFLSCANMTNAERAFKNCSSLTSIIYPFSNCLYLKNIDNIFDGCSSLESSIGLFSHYSKLNNNGTTEYYGSSISSARYAFKNCSNLLSLDLNVYNKPDIEGLFDGASFSAGNHSGVKSVGLQNIQSLTSLQFVIESLEDNSPYSEISIPDTQNPNNPLILTAEFQINLIRNETGKYANCISYALPSQISEALAKGWKLNCETSDVPYIEYCPTSASMVGKTVDVGKLFNDKAYQNAEKTDYFIPEYCCQIDWGDNSKTGTITNDNFKTISHTYKTDTGSIKIYGTCDYLYENPNSVFNEALNQVNVHSFEIKGVYFRPSLKAVYKPFAGCKKMWGISKDIFWNCTEAKMLRGVFEGCSSYKAINWETFSYCKALEDISDCFKGCGLESIYQGLFSENNNLKTAEGTFQNCSNLHDSPVALFENNDKMSSYKNCFSGIPNLESAALNLYENDINFQNVFGDPNTQTALKTVEFINVTNRTVLSKAVSQLPVRKNNDGTITLSKKEGAAYESCIVSLESNDTIVTQAAARGWYFIALDESKMMTFTLTNSNSGEYAYLGYHMLEDENNELVYNFFVDWDDGSAIEHYAKSTVSRASFDPETFCTHKFLDTKSTRNVKIYGDFDGFGAKENASNDTIQPKLTKISCTNSPLKCVSEPFLAFASLQTIPSNLFINCYNQTGYEDEESIYSLKPGRMFNGTKISSIPSGLLDGFSKNANWTGVFTGTEQLTEIPFDIFDKTLPVTTGNIFSHYNINYEGACSASGIKRLGLFCWGDCVNFTGAFPSGIKRIEARNVKSKRTLDNLIDALPTSTGDSVLQLIISDNELYGDSVIDVTASQKSKLDTKKWKLETDGDIVADEPTTGLKFIFNRFYPFSIKFTMLDTTGMTYYNAKLEWTGGKESTSKGITSANYKKTWLQRGGNAEDTTPETLTLDLTGSCDALVSDDEGLYIQGAQQWLKSVDVIENSPLKECKSAFTDCSYLESVSDEIFDNCVNATDASYTFKGCSLLGNVGEKMFSRCSNIISYNETYKGCTNLSTAALNLWSSPECLNTFADCPNLKTVYFWNVKKGELIHYLEALPIREKVDGLIYLRKNIEEASLEYADVKADFKARGWKFGDDETDKPTLILKAKGVPAGTVIFNQIANNTSYVYDFEIDWGDGSLEDYSNPNNEILNLTHSYDTSGDYDIIIKGTFDGFISNPHILTGKEMRSFIQSIDVVNSSPLKHAKESFAYWHNLETVSERIFEKCSEETSFDTCFFNTAITTIPDNIFQNCINATDFSDAFRNTKISSVPTNLFANCPLVESFADCFNSCSNLEKIDNIFSKNVNVKSFAQCFDGCTSLKEINADLFANNKSCENFQGCFKKCNFLIVPEDLFKYNTEAKDFSYCFANCKKMVDTPDNLFASNKHAITFSHCFENTNLGSPYNANGGCRLFANNTEAEDFSYCFAGTNLISIYTTEEMCPIFANNKAAKNFSHCFDGCSGMSYISDTLFANNVDAYDFSYCFANCSVLIRLENPSGGCNLFANNKKAENFEGCFQNCKTITSIPSTIFETNSGVLNFSYCFAGCNALSSIPSTLFKTNTEVRDFSYCFANCYDIMSLDESLFYENRKVESFEGTFKSLPYIQSIPEKLFSKNTEVTNFSRCFEDCFNIGSNKVLPANIFRYNTKVKFFYKCFWGCMSITLDSSHADLFRYNTDVEDFSYCFWGCDAITTIPSLFSYNKKAKNFSHCFDGCYRLSSIPTGGIFSDTANIEKIDFCFRSCTALTQVPYDLFASQSFNFLSSETANEGVYAYCNALTIACLNLYAGINGTEGPFNSTTDDGGAITSLHTVYFYNMRDVNNIKYLPNRTNWNGNGTPTLYLKKNIDDDDIITTLTGNDLELLTNRGWVLGAS